LVAFVGSQDRRGETDVSIAEPDGSHVRRINDPTGIDEVVGWSPDMHYLLITHQPPNTSRRLFAAVMSTDDGSVRKLTPGTALDWSPDGDWILLRNEDGLAKVRTDGTELSQLSRFGVAGTWSPDGEWIVFASTRVFDCYGEPCETSQIQKMRPDGSARERLVPKTGLSLASSLWSPDGTGILYVRCSPCRLFLMDPDGHNRHAIPMKLPHYDDRLDPHWETRVSPSATAALDSPSP
jgi:Tol biopolymer transport system component